MKSSTTDADYEAAVRHLDAAAAWLKSIGIRLAGSRLEVYRRHMEGSREARGRGRLDAYCGARPE